MTHYSNKSQWDDYKKYPYAIPSREPLHKQAPPTTVISIDDVFPKLDRWSIGYSSTFDSLQQLAKQAKASSYPPYNVKKFDDGVWRIDMAVAGFRKDELEISVQDSILTIKSQFDLTEEDHELKDALVLHQGIAQRAFTTNFALAEYVEVQSAEYKDGILTIKLVTNLPEDKKPRTIEIN